MGRHGFDLTRWSYGLMLPDLLLVEWVLLVG